MVKVSVMTSSWWRFTTAKTFEQKTEFTGLDRILFPVFYIVVIVVVLTIFMKASQTQPKQEERVLFKVGFRVLACLGA